MLNIVGFDVKPRLWYPIDFFAPLDSWYSLDMLMYKSLIVLGLFSFYLHWYYCFVLVRLELFLIRFLIAISFMRHCCMYKRFFLFVYYKSHTPSALLLIVSGSLCLVCWVVKVVFVLCWSRWLWITHLLSRLLLFLVFL